MKTAYGSALYGAKRSHTLLLTHTAPLSHTRRSLLPESSLRAVHAQEKCSHKDTRELIRGHVHDRAQESLSLPLFLVCVFRIDARECSHFRHTPRLFWLPLLCSCSTVFGTAPSELVSTHMREGRHTHTKKATFANERERWCTHLSRAPMWVKLTWGKKMKTEMLRAIARARGEYDKEASGSKGGQGMT